MRFAFACSAAFAGLAGLVATGVTNGIDRWAMRHTMPGFHPSGHRQSIAESVVPLLHAGWHGGVHVLVELVTLPAQILVSLALLLVFRKWWWLVPWAAASIVEEICKLTLTRPDFPVPFDHSYPSGHTLRALVLAAAIGSGWAWAWAAAAIVMLDVGGFHVPTDIAGGLLLAAALLGARRLARGRAGRARA